MVCALDYHGRKLRTRFSLLELANCIAHICSETKAKIRTFALLLHFPLICTSQHVLDPNTLGCAGECSTMALLLKWQYYPPPPLPKKKNKKKTKKKNKQTSMVSTPLQQDKKKTKNSNEKGAWTKDQFNFHLVWLLRSQASLTSVSQTSTLTQLKVFSFSGQPGLISGRLDT